MGQAAGRFFAAKGDARSQTAGRCAGHPWLPATAQHAVQIHSACQPREALLGQGVAGAEQGALGFEHRQQRVGAFAVAALGQLQRALGLGRHLGLGLFLARTGGGGAALA